MGHTRLGTLPTTRKWNQVLSLLNEKAGTSEVAGATLSASQSGFLKAGNDEGLIQSVWLLSKIALAARQPDFPNNLKSLGLQIPDESTLLDIVAAFTHSVDQHLFERGERSDVGEMAQLSASETLTSLVGEESQSLFGTTHEDVRRAFRKFSTTKQFGGLLREFFARFSQRYLTYFLSRELSNHVGKGKLFSNIQAHSEFIKALRLHCFEASRIVEEFSSGWFSKTKFFEGDITPEKTKKFAGYAVRKLKDEFAKRGGAQP